MLTTSHRYDTDAVHYATRPSVESVNNLVEIVRALSITSAPVLTHWIHYAQKEGCYSKAPVSAMDDVIISVSVFRHKLSRPSLRLGGQHTFLASQTLGDLMDVVACVSNDIPAEVSRRVPPHVPWTDKLLRWSTSKGRFRNMRQMSRWMLVHVLRVSRLHQKAERKASLD